MPAKILTIVGARPQFIKASALSRALADQADFQEILVHTGQHYDAGMSAVFFAELGLPEPKYNLGVKASLHGAMTAGMLQKIEVVLLEEKPDLVLIYGDTNSSLAGALAASKLHIPIAHVEAGLRSKNWRMPEEQNRVLCDRMSQLLFPPSRESVDNLKAEGIPNSSDQMLVEVGDIMLDVALQNKAKAMELEFHQKFQLQPQSYIVCTCHRAENVDDPDKLRSIVRALEEVNKRIPVLLLQHPRREKRMAEWGISSSMEPIAPVSYLEMQSLLLNAKAVITDSGGLQKEAFYAGVHCFTLREQTEWVELLTLGVNTLVKEADQLAQTVALFLEHYSAGSGFKAQPYGDGQSAERIVNSLRQYLNT